MSKFTEMGKKPRKFRKLRRFLNTILTALYISPIIIGFSVTLYYKLNNEIPPRYTAFYLLFEVLPFIMCVLLAVMIILRIFRYIRALFKRISFIKSLKRVCKEHAYKLEIRQNPYKSIFFSSSKPVIVVTTNEKIFVVYFFTALRKGSALVFYDENYAEFWHYIMRQVPPLKRSKFYNLSDITLENNDLPIEKVLLISPTPFQIYKGSSEGHAIVDNNEKMFGYTLYAGSGFCNMIDRLHIKVEPIKIKRYGYQ